LAGVSFIRINARSDSRSLLLPAPTEQAECAEAGGEEREGGRERDGDVVANVIVPWIAQLVRMASTVHMLVGSEGRIVPIPRRNNPAALSLKIIPRRFVGLNGSGGFGSVWSATPQWVPVLVPP
jgi:hypothetical protein